MLSGSEKTACRIVLALVLILLAAGQMVGRVAIVHDYGAGTSLEIEREGVSPLLVPFTLACVPSVDTAAGTLVVTPPDEVLVPDEAQAAE